MNIKENNTVIDRCLSVAPMMDWTDRYCRYFHRLLAPNALLYTEMITTGAIIHGDRQKLLGYDMEEKPLAIQLGGSDPTQLAYCTEIAEEYGFDEINLNVGCPSDRVQSGQFGACLMLKPTLVADCMRAMCAATQLPVTVKCRIGVDHNDSYDELKLFIEQVARAGCKVFIVHARKAWLNGLSPKQNREIPPLQYETVYQLKQDFPEFTIVMNGGINNMKQIDEHLQQVDGVMLGRAAYQDPFFLMNANQHLYANKTSIDRVEIIKKYTTYMQTKHQQGVPIKRMTRHILGLFNGLPGAKNWRRKLSESVHGSMLPNQLMEDALTQLI